MDGWYTKMVFACEQQQHKNRSIGPTETDFAEAFHVCGYACIPFVSPFFHSFLWFFSIRLFARSLVRSFVFSVLFFGEVFFLGFRSHSSQLTNKVMILYDSFDSFFYIWDSNSFSFEPIFAYKSWALFMIRARRLSLFLFPFSIPPSVSISFTFCLREAVKLFVVGTSVLLLLLLLWLLDLLVFCFCFCVSYVCLWHTLVHPFVIFAPKNYIR